jgi:ligand-binding sensor domain-containing protein
VNAEQVKALLSQNVRLNNDGEVEVVDSKGAVRYTDAGGLVGVNDLVREFLDLNPHFVQSAPSTTNTKSSHNPQLSTGVDISKLDMKNPEHRKIYAEARAKGKI